MLTSLSTRATHGWVDFSGLHPTSVIDGNLPQTQKALVPSGRLWELGVGTLPQAMRRHRESFLSGTSSKRRGSYLVLKGVALNPSEVIATWRRPLWLQ